MCTELPQLLTNLNSITQADSIRLTNPVRKNEIMHLVCFIKFVSEAHIVCLLNTFGALWMHFDEQSWLSGAPLLCLKKVQYGGKFVVIATRLV